jgi:hypothetical protein
MTATLACDHLVTRLHPQRAALPDDRKGQHTPDAIQEAALGAWAVFLTQAPAVVADQRTRPQAQGRRNAERLLGRGASPWAHQIRTWLDPGAPAELWPGLAGGDDALDGAGQVSPWRVVADQRLLAWDGTDDGASPARHGARCAQRTQAHGPVTSCHHAMPPVMVAPGRHEGIPWEPEVITPQAGPAQPDGVQVAAQRWMARQAGRSLPATRFGNERDGTPPCWALGLPHGVNGSVVCPPASPPTLYAWRAG